MSTRSFTGAAAAPRDCRPLSHFTRPWASVQQGNRRRRVHDHDWGSRAALGIPRHEDVASCCLSRSGADGILEIPPPQGQRTTKNGPIDGCHPGDGQEVADDPTRKGGIALASGQIEDRRYAVRRDDGFDLLPLCRSPEGACGLAERRPVENKVEDDIHIEEDPLQRYFRSR